MCEHLLMQSEIKHWLAESGKKKIFIGGKVLIKVAAKTNQK